MEIIYARNVNGAYRSGLERIRKIGVEQDSRAGPVLVAPTPVMTVYARPYERVLLDQQRDANPFFHFFESLWMLQGRRDATWLDQFVSDFSSRFAEEDGLQHGAYGFRWRRHFDMEGGGDGDLLPDQFLTIVNILRKNPLDRRVVLQMWDPVADLGADVRDVPCNTQIYPRVRQEPDGSFLDLTVCCRSNDIVWGAYGANAVHFSVLQEVMAGLIGCQVGKLYQLSNNWHAYTSILDRFEGAGEDLYSHSSAMYHQPIVDRPESWMGDLERFQNDPFDSVYLNRFFSDVAMPMLWTHHQYKQGDIEAAEQFVHHITAPDWRHACRNWLAKRRKRS